MCENVLKLSNDGFNLGMRELGKKLSIEVRKAIENKQPIVIDFSKVDSVSSSFADELIAKVMCETGKDVFLNFVSIKNANPFIKKIISLTISERVQSN